MKKFIAALALIALATPALADSVRIDVYGNHGGFSYHHHERYERRSYGVQEYRQYIPPAPVYVAPPVYVVPAQPYYAPGYIPPRPQRYDYYQGQPQYHQHNHHYHYGR